MQVKMKFNVVTEVSTVLIITQVSSGIILFLVQKVCMDGVLKPS